MSPAKKGKKKIAIIGGGIAGLYCALRLCDTEHDFTVYEATSRIGGRIFTGKFDFKLQPESHAILGNDLPKDHPFSRDIFYPEYGPMRIEPEHQRLLQGLLDELEIKGVDESGPKAVARLINFPAYASPLSEFQPEYPLTGEEAAQETPLDLMKLGFVRILGRLRIAETKPDSPKENEDTRAKERMHLENRLTKIKNDLMIAIATRQADWKGVLQRWIDSLYEEDLENMRDYGAFEVSEKIAAPLHRMGFWNLLSHVLSHNAVMKLRDMGTFYHLLPENPNAAEWLIFWLRALLTTEKLQGLDNGMERIIDIMGERIEKKRPDSIVPNRTLQSLHGNADGKIVLTFVEAGKSSSHTTDADHVILAIPKAPLEKLALQNREVFPPEIVDQIDAVFGFPLVKVFAVVKKRWWEEDQRANVGATSIPTRELHYWKSRTPGSTRGMVMIYTDRPGSAFWANYIGKRGEQNIPDGPAKPTDDEFRREQSTRLKHKILQVLREVGSKTLRESEIEDFGIMDWGRAPYGGAAHAWRPERRASDILSSLSAFCLTGSARKTANVHVCGEAYSDYQAFIEGSLRSALHVLHLIDPNRPQKIDKTKTVYTMTPWLCPTGDQHAHCQDERRTKRMNSEEKEGRIFERQPNDDQR